MHLRMPGKKIKFMNGSATSKVQVYNKHVGLKFQLYNSLFTALPFHRVEKTGVLLSIFMIHCEEGYAKQQSPVEIIDSFVQQYTSYTEQEKLDLLFRFVQYAERQVVLFDALEDAAFRHINDMNGPGTLKHLSSEVHTNQSQEQLAEKLKDFSVRLVLTAHPTQFYPSEVLGIINDLSKALLNDNTAQINSYLQQLGKTPFFKAEKPTPYIEAVSLIWFLENVFYQSAGQILSYLKNQFPEALHPKNPLIRLGFWPGGDRDGNPFVNAGTTLEVAEALRGGIIKSYYQDVRKMKRRLTFKGVADIVATLEKRLYANLFTPEHQFDLRIEEIEQALEQIREILIEKHNGLFLNLVENLISKTELFGLFFASLDIRQDSSVHNELLDTIAKKSTALPDNYSDLSDADKIQAMLSVKEVVDPSLLKENELFEDTLRTIASIKEIQQTNGEDGCHRYIISHSTSAVDIMQVYGLFLLSGWKGHELSVDIVPLFETITDLQNAAGVMKSLYENKVYLDHLQKRRSIQTIMLGFSDGTKDGGYLMANWSIYKAKEELTAMSKQYGIDVVFFDGRGGPPARGGGRTHQFYASMGQNISNKEIQLTIQGQTISSNFGTPDSSQFNIEQLMHAGISNALHAKETTLSTEEEELFQALSDESFKAYNTLKNHPNFLEYLNFASPLRYYGEANIGSRPSKRKPGKLNLDDLRAVPYVGSWSQLKQNLPGYYGVGLALEKLKAEGKWDSVKQLYKRSLFFKTLMDNCEMAMSKSFFPLTAFLAKNPVYGELWDMIHDEFERTKKHMLELSEATELMEDKPINKLSIQMRQRIELPLLSVQQYALTKIREIEEQGADDKNKKIYEKLVMRCSFGIINAERNSA